MRRGGRLSFFIPSLLFCRIFFSWSSAYVEVGRQSVTELRRSEMSGILHDGTVLRKQHLGVAGRLTQLLLGGTLVATQRLEVGSKQLCIQVVA